MTKQGSYDDDEELDTDEDTFEGSESSEEEEEDEQEEGEQEDDEDPEEKDEPAPGPKKSKAVEILVTSKKVPVDPKLKKLKEQLKQIEHAAATVFPLMSDDELKVLREDIAKTKGNVEAIVWQEGKLLDGRNRLLACQYLGIEPASIEWQGEAGSPVAFVISKNLNRRHLSASQRAVAASDLEPLLAEEAKKRKEASQFKKQQKSPQNTVGVKILLTGKGDAAEHEKSEQKPVSLKPQSTGKGKAAEQAAKAVGANVKYVQKLKKLKQEAPAIASLVKENLVSILQAEQIAQLDGEMQQKVIEKIKNGAIVEDVLPIAADLTQDDEAPKTSTLAANIAYVLDNYPVEDVDIAELRKDLKARGKTITGFYNWACALYDRLPKKRAAD